MGVAVDAEGMHVLMFGSGRLSAGRAVKRLRRISDAGEIAMTGSFRGSSPSVPLLSPDKAESWLRRLHGVALFVHDDVTFDPSDIELLRQAHVLSGTLTAAATDTAQVEDIPLIFGPPAMLADFLGEVRTDAERSSKIGLVDDVRVDHALDCRSLNRRPLLVASMIVRDEADQIGECLSSLQGLADRVEIVDTGSVDDTIAIARAHGASVTTAEWTDDFGAARNLALNRCRDARFVLHVDADERLITPDIERFRQTLESTKMRAARIPMRNVVNGRVTSEFEAVRVFSTEETKWVGRVHEYPADTDGTPLASGRLDSLRIDHLGYDPQIVAAKDKWGRNVKLAEAAYRAEPSFKTRLDLARSLAWQSDDARAFALFREAASDLTGASQGAAAFVIAHVALSHQIEGEFDRTHELAVAALEYCSGEHVAHLARARAWRATGDDQTIVDAHDERMSSELEAPMFDTTATRTMTDNLTVGALARLGRHVDALELAVSVLEADPLRFDEWSSLATMPPTLRERGLPLLASMDPTGGFTPALVGEIPMHELAALVLAHVQSHAPDAQTVITGIMAGVISGDEATATRIAELGAESLDPEERAATAERCRLREANGVATILEASTDHAGLAR